MKRVFIIGVIGFATAAILMVGVLLAMLVSPVRAYTVREQVGQVLGEAVERVQVVTGQIEAPAVENNTAQSQGTGVQIKDEKGVLVAGVFQDSPADKAGLVRGDIILEVDGQAVNTTTDLNSILRKHQAGDTLKLLVQHGDTQKTVTVTLAEQPGAAPAAQSTPQNGQQEKCPNRQKVQFQSGPYLGIIPIGAGQYNFKTEALRELTAGARITQVSANSPAEKAGLKVGEVILSVDGTKVDAQHSLGTLITSHKPGDSVKLSVQGTDGTEREATVILADHPQQAGTAYLGVSTAEFGRGFGHGTPDFPEMPDLPNLPGLPVLPGDPFPVNPEDIPNQPSLTAHPGAFLQQVIAGSPAADAGLKVGQIVEAVDGKKLVSADALAETIAAKKPGDRVTLTVYDPKTNTASDVQVVLGENPQEAGTAWMGIQYGFFNMDEIPLPERTPADGGTQF